MNIALIGYGKMGKVIHEVAEARGHHISVIVNSAHPIKEADFTDVDVAIEFSIPQLATKHIHYLLDHSIPVVVGTTGWNSELESLTKKTNLLKGSLLHASNFSIGVNLFFALNEYLATLMGQHPDYYVSMEEIHHTQKLDAPSGTAISLAEGIIKHHPAVDNWNCPQSLSNQEFNGGIEINAIREPNVPGTHTIKYESTIDTITIQHEAKNRKGFATGAVLASEWLISKKGVFTMKDVLALNY